MHLLFGFIASYVFLRAAGVRVLFAGMGSLSFILSGFFLIAGRSWYYMTPSAVWCPLLLLALIRLQQGKVSTRWVIFTGLIIGIYFHSGNIQMWAYAMGFFVLGIILLIVSNAIPYKKGLMAIPALVLGISIAAPLLVPQMEFVAQVTRIGHEGGTVSPGLAATIFPYSLTNADKLGISGSAIFSFLHC